MVARLLLIVLTSTLFFPLLLSACRFEPKQKVPQIQAELPEVAAPESQPAETAETQAVSP